MTASAPEQILLTGGSGLLGTELRSLLPGMVAPSREELDVLEPATIRAALSRYQPKVLVHAAAFTDVSRAERAREECWEVNVRGTRNVAVAAGEAGVFLVHMSTDYVFDGVRGQYAEDDVPGMPINYYAMTKIAAEVAARAAKAHLVIRTSFRPREWPYPVAFTDVYTSQDYVDVVAPKIALAITHCRTLGVDTLHIATERKSAYELARRRVPDVRAGSRKDASVNLPEDCSLACQRWNRLEQELRAKAG